MEPAQALLMIGALGVVTGLLGVARTYRLVHRGLRAEAVVAEVQRVRLGSAGKGARQLGFEPVYEFRDMDGVTHRLCGKVRGKRIPRIGSTRAVHYHRDRPDAAVFSGGRAWLAPIGLLLLSLAVIGLGATLLPGA